MNKLLVIVLIGALYVSSWYMMFDNSIKKDATYKNYISQADQYIEDKLYIQADETLAELLKLYPQNIDLQLKRANLYLMDNNSNKYVSYMKKLIKNFPTSSKIFDEYCKYYYKINNYLKCHEVIKEIKDRHIKSKVIDDIASKIKYSYDVYNSGYSEVKPFGNLYAPVKQDGNWAYIDCYGRPATSFMYSYASVFLNNNAGVISNNEAYLVDLSFIKQTKVLNNYIKFNSKSDDIILAEKQNKYVYLTAKDNSILFNTEFEEATNFYNNRAAVKQNNLWKIIDEKGQKIGKSQFEEILIDDFNSCNENNVIFVKIDGKYQMADLNGNIICDKKFDNVKPFLDTTYAAVKQGEKWGFVDNKGNFKIKPTYTNADSFAIGLAAVETDGYWGYIDINNKVVIKPQYQEAKSFNYNGSAFVKTSQEWSIIRLHTYVFNN